MAVKTKDDIIKEVVAKTGKSKKVVEAVFENSIKRIREIIQDEEETVRINLPSLGILKANYHLTHDLAKKSHVKAKERRQFMSDNYERTKNYDVPLLEYLYKGKYKKEFPNGETLWKYAELIDKVEVKNDEQISTYFK